MTTHRCPSTLAPGRVTFHAALIAIAVAVAVAVATTMICAMPLMAQAADNTTMQRLATSDGANRSGLPGGSNL